MTSWHRLTPGPLTCHHCCQVFKEIHRVLKPGGVAYMSFSNRCFPTKGEPQGDWVEGGMGGQSGQQAGVAAYGCGCSLGEDAEGVSGRLQLCTVLLSGVWVLLSLLTVTGSVTRGSATADGGSCSNDAKPHTTSSTLSHLQCILLWL